MIRTLPELAALVRTPVLTDLVETLTLAPSPQDKEAASWIVRSMAEKQGVFTSSIQPLYHAFGRGEVSGFTVPAINVRGVNFEMSRAIFRTARKLDARAFVFEIAKSEMGYTEQRPAEFAGLVLAAALREGWRGPVFIQGDHFQFNAKKYKENPQAELEGIKKLTAEAIQAGFLNIDIDASTLVDLGFPTVREQQKHNIDCQAALIEHIRKIQPVEISIGGEIGEVGKKNSTVEEFTAFADGVREKSSGLKFMSKVSIQTGTSHGGKVLPDGTTADVAIDFDCHRDISRAARERYAMAGTVQHGASTLPLEKFNQFPPVGCVEIHLATEFQNIIYQHVPEELKKKVYDWVRANLSDEFKSNETEEQNLYKTRKKAWGPFKKEFFRLDPALYLPALEERLEAMFRNLKAAGTAAAVEKHVKLLPSLPAAPAALASRL
jgi:fructose/tagatose bisphosphate aldolase